MKTEITNPSKKFVIDANVIFLYLKRNGGVIGSTANLNSIKIYRAKKNIPAISNIIITSELKEYFVTFNNIEVYI